MLSLKQRLENIEYERGRSLEQIEVDAKISANSILNIDLMSINMEEFIKNYTKYIDNNNLSAAYKKSSEFQAKVLYNLIMLAKGTK